MATYYYSCWVNTGNKDRRGILHSSHYYTMLPRCSELHIKCRMRRDLKDHEKNAFFASVQASASAHRKNTISAQAASPHQES